MNWLELSKTLQLKTRWKRYTEIISFL